MWRNELKTGAILFVSCLVVYSLTSYGGVRSPDSEIVYRTCESLLSRSSWTVEPLALDPGFGVAPGRGGGLFSVFGPLESLVCVPVLGLWQRAGWAPRVVPPSTYVADGYRLMLDKKGATGDQHRARFFVSFLNAFLAAGAVVLLFRLGRVLQLPTDLAAITASLFGLGSLNWWYATTFFSEPLALLLVLWAFLWLQPDGGSEGSPQRSGALRSGFAGALLGAAVATHLSAVLFVPFFALYVWFAGRATRVSIDRSRAVIAFLAGAAVPVTLLGLYNQLRFGSPWETGRGVVANAVERFGYGEWVPPWEGLSGLLFSPGKGLLLFCPLVWVGLLALPAVYRRQRGLFWMIVGLSVTRLVVIGSRSDWHGGFGMGPRYLFLMVPFLLLPIGFWLDEARSDARLRGVLIVGVLAATQQFYFVLGDGFFYYHSLWLFAEQSGRPEWLEGVYFDWRFSPLFGLHRGALAPWIVRGWELSVGSLVGAFAFLAAMGAGAVYRWTESGSRTPVASHQRNP